VAGRRKRGEPTAFADYAKTVKHPALRIIARWADWQGLSVRAFAARARRDESTVRQAFDYDRTPLRRTIDRFARALELDPRMIHAWLDDLNLDECADALNEALLCARLETWSVSVEEAIEQIRATYRAASPDVQKAAARAWFLDADSDGVFREPLPLQGAPVKPWPPGFGPDGSFRSDQDRVRAFCRALDTASNGLCDLMPAYGEDPQAHTLWRVALAFRSLRFSEREVRRFLAPVIEELRRRGDPRIDAMLAQSRNNPFEPILLEESP
jgi:hypothetical protein